MMMVLNLDKEITFMSSYHLSKREKWNDLAQGNALKTIDIIMSCWNLLPKDEICDFSLELNTKNYLIANKMNKNEDGIVFDRQCRIKPDVILRQKSNVDNVIYIEAKNQKSVGNATERMAIKSYSFFDLEKDARDLNFYPFFNFFLYESPEAGLVCRLKNHFKNQTKKPNKTTIDIQHFIEYNKSWKDYLFMSAMDNQMLKDEIKFVLFKLIKRLKDNVE